MSKRPENKFADLDPNDKQWVKFGLVTIRDEYLPSIALFFQQMGSRLNSANLVNSGFPYELYLQGSSYFYSFDDGLYRMKEVLSGVRQPEITWLLSFREGKYYEDASGRASFLGLMAEQNRLAQKAQALPAGEQNSKDLTQDDMLIKHKADIVIASTRKLYAAFASDNIATNGFPSGRVNAFQNQVASFHKTATRIERAQTELEIDQFCKNAGYNPEDIKAQLRGLDSPDAENPIPGFLGIAFNPGSNLLSLIQGKKTEPRWVG